MYIRIYITQYYRKVSVWSVSDSPGVAGIPANCSLHTTSTVVNLIGAVTVHIAVLCHCTVTHQSLCVLTLSYVAACI